MIALHRWIARPRKSRWLVPLVILVVILLALFLVFHSSSDAVEAGASIACAVIGLVISLVLILVLPRHYLQLVVMPARAPPHSLISAHPFRTGGSSRAGLIPLRL